MESRIINSKHLFVLASIFGMMLVMNIFRWLHFISDNHLHLFLPLDSATLGQAIFILGLTILRVFAMAVLLWLIENAGSINKFKWRILLITGIIVIVSFNLGISLVLSWPHWVLVAIRDYLILLFFLFPSICAEWKALPICLVLATAILVLYLKFPSEPSLNPDYVTAFSYEDAEALFNKYVELCNYVMDIFVVCCWAVANNAISNPTSSGLRIIILVVFFALTFIMITIFPFSPIILFLPAYTGACVFLNKRLFTN